RTQPPATEEEAHQRVGDPREEGEGDHPDEGDGRVRLEHRPHAARLLPPTAVAAAASAVVEHLRRRDHDHPAAGDPHPLAEVEAGGDGGELLVDAAETPHEVAPHE